MTLLVQVQLSPPNMSPWCSGSTAAFQAAWAGSNPVGDSSRGVVHLCSISFGWPGYSGPSSYGRLAQSVERRSVKPWVAGPSPAFSATWGLPFPRSLSCLWMLNPYQLTAGNRSAIRRVRVTVAQRSRKPTWTSVMGSWGFESSTFRHLPGSGKKVAYSMIGR